MFRPPDDPRCEAGSIIPTTIPRWYLVKNIPSPACPIPKCLKKEIKKDHSGLDSEMAKLLSNLQGIFTVFSATACDKNIL
jgi:hypothetical protein